MGQFLQHGSLALDQIYALFYYWSLASTRTLGATLFFTAFVWAHINSGVIRTALALALALPILSGAGRDPIDALAQLQHSFIFLAVKELFVGIVIGLMASLPIIAIGLAGNIIDAARGGAPLPALHGDDTVLGQLITVVGLWLFASLGGFWRFGDMLYASYGLWPLDAAMPQFGAGAMEALNALLKQLLISAVTLAGPLLVLMLVTDLVVLTASRIGRRLNVMDLTMSLKSLVVVLALPLYVIAVTRVFGSEFPRIFDLRILQAAFPQ